MIKFFKRTQKKESNLLRHAREELKRIGALDCPMQQAINKHILKMIELFSEEGHSGSSAPYTINTLKELLFFRPLTPLTGDDAEWFIHDHGEDMYAQNKRCGHVFKRRDGTAYDSEAFIFRDPDGSCWTSSESRKDITFPYTPHSEYVERPFAIKPEGALA